MLSKVKEGHAAKVVADDALFNVVHFRFAVGCHHPSTSFCSRHVRARPAQAFLSSPTIVVKPCEIYVPNLKQKPVLLVS